MAWKLILLILIKDSDLLTHVLLIRILYKEKIMNSVKLLLAAILMGAFTLSVAGCPSKKEEAPPAEAPVMDTMEETTEVEATEVEAPAEGTESAE